MAATTTAQAENKNTPCTGYVPSRQNQLPDFTEIYGGPRPAVPEGLAGGGTPLMDTAIANGDFSPGANGRPRAISGAEEKFQRAAIRLTVPRGAFCYDASLGSRLGTLTGQEDDPDGRALFYAQEALGEMTDVTVQSAQYLAGDAPSVRVSLLCGGQQKEIEVKI